MGSQADIQLMTRVCDILQAALQPNASWGRQAHALVQKLFFNHGKEISWLLVNYAYH